MFCLKLLDWLTDRLTEQSLDSTVCMRARDKYLLIQLYFAARHCPCNVHVPCVHVYTCRGGLVYRMSLCACGWTAVLPHVLCCSVLSLTLLLFHSCCASVPFYYCCVSVPFHSSGLIWLLPSYNLLLFIQDDYSSCSLHSLWYVYLQLLPSIGRAHDYHMVRAHDYHMIRTHDYHMIKAHTWLRLAFTMTVQSLTSLGTVVIYGSQLTLYSLSLAVNYVCLYICVSTDMLLYCKFTLTL